MTDLAPTSSACGTAAVRRQGAWVGLLDPKALILFTAFPQFLQPGAVPVPVQLLALGLVPVAVALVSDSLSGTGRRRSPGLVRHQPRAA
jgi:threonine/homoserine/homoserine lactone efflux protein